jgi:hypothetical protein
VTTDQDKVIAALLDVVGDRLSDRDVYFAAKTLMPVVEKIAARRKAEAWRAAAEACDRIGVPTQAAAFRAHADTLDPS